MIFRNLSFIGFTKNNERPPLRQLHYTNVIMVLVMPASFYFKRLSHFVLII